SRRPVIQPKPAFPLFGAVAFVAVVLEDRSNVPLEIHGIDFGPGRTLRIRCESPIPPHAKTRCQGEADHNPSRNRESSHSQLLACLERNGRQDIKAGLSMM